MITGQESIRIRPLDVSARTITYNADNMPTQIVNVKSGGTLITDILYDANGQRAKKTVQGGSTTYYINQYLEIIDGTPTKYIMAAGMRIAKLTPTETRYFHKDHLGSSVAMTDESGNPLETTEYMPFGHDRVHTGTSESGYKFTDQEKDAETGLYNYGARLYDPVIGQFISPDSIVPNIYDPQLLNPYAYCRNNPLIYTDPSGHSLVPMSDQMMDSIAIEILNDALLDNFLSQHTQNYSLIDSTPYGNDVISITHSSTIYLEAEQGNHPEESSPLLLSGAGGTLTNPNLQLKSELIGPGGGGGAGELVGIGIGVGLYELWNYLWNEDTQDGASEKGVKEGIEKANELSKKQHNPKLSDSETSHNCLWR